MNKTQRILLGMVVLQLVLIALVFFNSKPKIVPNEPLLPNLQTDKITAIKISDNSNNLIDIEKKNETWVLANSGDFPVLEQSVTSLLDSLKNIRTGRLVTNTKASHKRLQVADDDYQRKIVITSPQGDTTILMGSSPAPSNVHIRLANDDAVYLTNAITTNTASSIVSNWVNTSYVQLDSNAVTQIEVQSANGSFQFQKSVDNTWQFADQTENETLDASKWSSYLTAFTNLRMVMPVSTQMEDAFGLSNPKAKVTLHFTENGESKAGELTIGQQDSRDQNYYAKWSFSPYVVKISSFNAERIINLAKTDLISTPVTATP